MRTTRRARLLVCARGQTLIRRSSDTEAWWCVSRARQPSHEPSGRGGARRGVCLSLAILEAIRAPGELPRVGAYVRHGRSALRGRVQGATSGRPWVEDKLVSKYV